MDKLKLKAFLLNAETEKIGSTLLNIDEFISDTKLSFSEVRDADDGSHHHQATTDSNLAHKHVHEHLEHKEILEKLDFSPSSEVEPGAIVQVNDRFLVVATADGSFEFEGNQYFGISTEAPIYQCLKGKKEGEVCQFNNNSFTIKKIY